MSRASEERDVRQRGRFQCENCRKFGLAQYAHIIPDSEGGEYDFNNLLFLCYACHRELEPTLANGERKKLLMKKMYELRDRPKVDNLIEGVFSEFMANGDVQVILGGDNYIINTPRIFEENPIISNPSYLDVMSVEGSLVIGGRFKDEAGKVMIEFENTSFRLYTGDFWDVIRKPGKLEVVNITKRMRISLRQLDDLSLKLLGKFYVAGQKFELKQKECIFGSSHLSQNTIKNCPAGLRLG